MKKMLSLFAVLALVLTTVCLPALAETAAPIKVGAISPNTGDLAAYGEAVTNGIDLAVAEINAAGGVLDVLSKSHTWMIRATPPKEPTLSTSWFLTA